MLHVRYDRFAQHWAHVSALCADRNLPGRRCGFAGGIGVENISAVLDGLRKSASGETVWVDMETSLRHLQDGKDSFAMDRAEKCADIVNQKGFPGDGGDCSGKQSAASL